MTYYVFDIKHLSQITHEVLEDSDVVIFIKSLVMDKKFIRNNFDKLNEKIDLTPGYIFIADKKDAPSIISDLLNKSIKELK